MKLKTSLIAAATLAVGVISSQAQVYSQNIVGYINLTITNGSQYNMNTLQLSVGSSNGMNEVFTSFSTNQNNNVVYIWDKTAQSFKGGGYLWYWDQTLNGGVGGGAWYDQAGNGNVVTTYPTLSVGDAFYIQGNDTLHASDTLTITGSIANNSTNVVKFVGGGLYSLNGSPLPYAGGLYNLGFNPPDNTVVYIWDAAHQTFKGGGYFFYSGVNNGSSGGWYDQAGNGNVVTGTGITFTNGGYTFSDIPISVGDGFYINGGNVTGVGSTNWIQTINQ